MDDVRCPQLNPFTREFKIFYLSPQREFFQATVILDCLALLFPWRRVMLVMWHNHSHNSAVWHMDRFYFVFPFFIINIHKHTHYIMKYLIFRFWNMCK